MRRSTYMFFMALLLMDFTAAPQTFHHFRHLTMKDGLSDLKTYAISQDKYGNMWFGGTGLSRYNSHKIQKYAAVYNDSASLPDNDVRYIYCSRSGNLYISTLYGFCRYDYVLDRFQRSPFDIHTANSRVIETEDGILWMNSEKGLVIVDEKTGSVTELAKHKNAQIQKIGALHVTSFAIDNKDHIYLGTSSGFHRINYRTWTAESFRHKQDNPLSLRNNDVRNIVVDHSGKVWLSIGYYGSDLVKFDPVNKSFQYYEELHTQKNEWNDNRILEMLVDSRNQLWIATLRSSLVKFDVKQESFQYFLHDYANPASVSSNTVHTVFEDRESGIWLAALNSGIDYFNPRNYLFTSISKSDLSTPSLIDDWCQSVAEDKSGNLWIGTHQGLSYYDLKKNTFQNYLLAKQQSDEANNSIRSLWAAQNGTIWIGTGNGLNKLDPGSRRIRPVSEADSIPLLFFSQLYADKYGRLIAATQKGLYVYHQQLRRFEYIFKRPVLQQYRNSKVNTVFVDTHGIMWISLHRKGMLVYNEKQNTAQLFDFKTLNPVSFGLDAVTSIAEDQNGILWFTSSNGLIGFDNTRNTFMRFYENDGLPSNKTSGLLVDKKNRLWMGTTHGLCMLDAARKQFSVFEEKDGLLTGYFYEGNALKLKNGSFAYPTYKGILIFNPDSVESAPVNLSAAIAAIRIKGEDLHTGQVVRELQHIKLGPSQNFFSIELEALNYATPENTVFAYKLEGFNKDWIYTKDRVISFTNVPGGKYIFRYKATSNPKNWNVKEHSLNVQVAVVFYKTWWFWLLVSGLIITTTILFFRFRMNKQKQILGLATKAQQLEKEKTMVMYEGLKQQLNPHFLFNSLTSLSGLIQTNQPMAAEFLEHMSDIYRYILKNGNSETVLLKDEIAFVKLYINLQQTRFRKGLVVNFRVPEESGHYKIAPVTLQNLIENAIKHNIIDPASPLVIDVFIDNDYLVIKNNLQKKSNVETSNKKGLAQFVSLYSYLSEKPVLIEESEQTFSIKIPLI